MNEKEVFALALGLTGTPWEVVEISLDLSVKPGRLDIRLDFPPGSRFMHPISQQPGPIYDTAERSWRHMNFFQYECYVHAWVPRLDGGAEHGIKTVPVPWSRPGSGFTLLLEALIVLLSQTGMTVAEAARTIGETAHRLWRVLFHHVEQAHGQIEISDVSQLSVDETSVRRGHEYVTVVCEPGRRSEQRPTRVLFVAEGKEAQAVEQAREFLDQRSLQPGQIREICADMSAAYAKGVRENFPEARLVFDYFHVVGLLTQAVDAVRRRESQQFPELLKGTRYLWLKNEENLSEEQQQHRARLCRSKLQTAKAHGQLAAFQDLLKAHQPKEAVEGLKWWCAWVMRSRLPEMKRVVTSIREHWDGLVAYLETRLTNGPAEAINGIIQTAKRKARGFRNFEYFRTIIYLIGSKLKFDLPTPVPVHP